MNAKKWYPWDGYGFNVSPMEIYHGGVPCRREQKEFRAVFEQTSQVKVLKLHGSVGWCLKDQDLKNNSEIYFRYANSDFSF